MTVAPMLTMQITMGEAFREVVAGRRNQEALMCRQVRLTYDQLLARVEALASGLHRLGVRQGDKIACLLPPGDEFAVLFFAVAELGAVIVPLNPQSRPWALVNVLSQVEPIALITARTTEGELLDQVASLSHIIYSSYVEEPSLSQSPGLVEGEVEEGALSLGDLISAQQIGGQQTTAVSPNDLLALLFTSGTTGTPKGTMHTHKSLIAPVAASTKLRELWMQRPSLKMLGRNVNVLARYRARLLRAAGKPQTFLSTVGWHTITGLEVMLQGILMGDRLVVMPRFHPREALRLVEQERITVLIGVPMAFQMMLRVEGFERYNTSSLLICGTGSAPCSPSLAREIQQRFGCAVHIGFGATETAGGIAATSIADSNERQAATVGRPMPGTEVKIVDEYRRELPPGEVGELACRSESLMLGYYQDAEATAEVIDSDGWYYTGDLAVIDELGYLRIIGRKKDMIIRGGQNIHPAEIETYLVTHPKIREAAVVGVPSEVGGEAAWVYLQLEEGAEMMPQEVLDYCRAELEPYMIPSQVRIVTDFPRSETGKPRKFELRDQALKEMEGRGRR